MMLQVGLVCFSFLIYDALAVCTFPSPFANSTWLDSTRGTLTFTTTELSGWGISVFNQVLSTWQCVDNSSSTSLIMRTKANITYSKTAFYAYACLQLTQITNYSYSYIQQQVAQSNAGNDRLYFSSNKSITNVSTICSSSVNIPTLEFHVLVKKGSGSSAAITFPDKLLVTADYDYYDGDGNVACNSTKDKMDMCTNQKALTFNYTTCSQKIAYSNNGSLWCVAKQSMGSYDCAVVFNRDSTISGTASQFACLCSNGTSVSVVSGNCTSDQTPTAFPTAADGTEVIGYKLLLPTIYVNCAPTTTTVPPTSAGIGGGAIAGIIIGVLVLVAIIIVSLILYKRGQCSTICGKLNACFENNACCNKVCSCCKNKVSESEKPILTNGVDHATTIDETKTRPKLAKDKTMMSAITMTSSLAGVREKSELEKSLIRQTTATSIGLDIKSERSSVHTLKVKPAVEEEPRLKLFGKDLSCLVCCPKKQDDAAKTVSVAEAPEATDIVAPDAKKAAKSGGKKGGKGKAKGGKKDAKAEKPEPEKEKVKAEVSDQNGELTRAPTKMMTDLNLTSTPIPGGEKGVKGVVSVPAGLEKPKDRETGWTFLTCCYGNRTPPPQLEDVPPEPTTVPVKKEKAAVKGKSGGTKKAAAKKGGKKAGKGSKKADINSNDLIEEDLTVPPPPVERAKTMPEKQREKTTLSIQDAEKVKVDVYVPDEKNSLPLKDTITVIKGSKDASPKLEKAKTDIGIVRPSSEKRNGSAKGSKNGKKVKKEKESQRVEQRTKRAEERKRRNNKPWAGLDVTT